MDRSNCTSYPPDDSQTTHLNILRKLPFKLLLEFDNVTCVDIASRYAAEIFFDNLLCCFESTNKFGKCSESKLVALRGDYLLFIAGKSCRICA